jgi:predicted acylesterase/phospholipase RssA
MSRAKPPGYLPVFCRSILLPNVLLLVLGLTVGGFGADFGITYLVWHDDPHKQFWVGFAMALISLQALYIGFLLWAKKAGRPDQFARFPELADRVTPHLFFTYCLWVVGQLVLLVVVIGVLVLLVQKIDAYTHGTTEAAVADTDDSHDVPPPRPNYGPWLPLGAAAAAMTIFLGGWAAKHAFRLISTPSALAAPRRLMTWLVDSAEEHPGPPRGGFLVALWAARTHGSPFRRLGVALFNQTLCLSVGVVFVAVWEQSHLSIAIGIGAAMLFGLVAVRARWLHDGRVFRAFLLLLGGLGYFVVTWLGSRPWCGWPPALAIGVFLAAIIPMGIRYTFPGPTARLLRATNDRIIDPHLCRQYPFHGVAVLFFLFGVTVLFVLPMVSDPVRSPLVLGSFLIFMALTLYGFVAYTIDDALPYLAPGVLVLVVLSGMPQYKMQFVGLDYVVRGADGGPEPLLDLQAAATADADRQQAFHDAVGHADGKPSAEADRLWDKLEDENRVLPGKDLRPGALVSRPGKLLALSDVPFTAVSAKLGGPAGGKKPMVVVVASGGGIRAAAWTFLVLTELEARFAEEGIPFPYHVRLVCGASGGMFGASYYTTSLRGPAEMSWGDDRRQEMAHRLNKLTQDWLTPISESLVTNDVPGFFSPFPCPTDRGMALERAWSKGLDGELDVTFEQLAERERAGWCPSIAFSPMMIEDGRRLLISNLDLRYPASNDGHLLEYDPDLPKNLADLNRNYSHDGLELFRMFPASRGRFALSTAIRMSASFPFLSPAVSLPTKPRRRVVDAGYFDNYGVSLAAAVLFSKKNTDWVRENVSKVVVLQIRDGQSDDERQLRVIPDAKRAKGVGSLLSRSLEEITSPLEGLSNARVGTCSFRNDGLLELLSVYFEQIRNEPASGDLPQANRFFTVVNFEFPGHVALSWHMSKGEQEQIRRTFEDKNDDRCAELDSKIAALLEWWKADVYEAPEPKVKARTVGRQK